MKRFLLFFMIFLPIFAGAEGLVFMAGGEGCLTSLEYEKSVKNFFVKTGLSIVPGDSGYIGVPFNAGFLTGNKIKFEYGAGVIYVPRDNKDKFIFPLFAGIRYPVKKNLYLRAILSPLFFKDDSPF